MVVVKDAGYGASAYADDGEGTFVPTSPSRVVERVGGGDAVAAGYLSAALLECRGAEEGLRRGHRLAAAALATRDDVPA